MKRRSALRADDIEPQARHYKNKTGGPWPARLRD
jgi:hypothetical protein